MSGILSRATQIFFNDGPIVLIKQTLSFCGKYSPSVDSLRFMFLDSFSDGPKSSSMLIRLRDSTLDSDALSLLVLAEKNDEISTIYLAIEDEYKFRERHKGIQDKLNNLSIRINPVVIGSGSLRDAFIQSHIVLIRGSKELLDYRMLNRNPDRKFVYLGHGFAKARGNMKPPELEKQEENRTVTHIYRKPYVYTIFHCIDLYSVSTDFELYARSVFSGCHPWQFEKCGYPKFNRLNELRYSEAKPLIPIKSQNQLESDPSTYQIIYAPTQKGHSEATRLFPFDDFDIDQFKQFLDSIDATMWIRCHINEENAGVYDGVVDGDKIKYAGLNMSTSATEILPYFDMMITDYSSIFTEYLALDRPIIFAIDESHQYWKNRGFAFRDEHYFPGPNVGNVDKLCETIEKCLLDDPYVSQRQKAIHSLVPSEESNFLDCVRRKLFED